MSEKKIFGISEEEVKRQLAAKGVDVDPESKLGPLSRGKMLDVCIEGGEKILRDPHTKAMLGRIYRGE